MGFSIVFSGGTDSETDNDTDGPFSLATASGLKSLSYWFAAIDGGGADYPRLSSLLLRGMTANTRQLSRELKAVSIKHRPSNPFVRSTLAGLRRLVGVGDEAESVYITSD